MTGVTKPLIVDAALRVLDESGIDAVTVRAVARELGVQAPALYWHVRNKQEILDEMGTEIQRRVSAAMAAHFTRHPEAARAPWTDLLGVYAARLRAEYLRHRDGARTFSGTRLTDPGVLAAQEPLLHLAVDQGVALRDAVDAAQLVTAFVVGFVIEEQERDQSGPDRYDLPERSAALGESAPLARASGEFVFSDPEERFTRQLDMLLAGVAALSRPDAMSTSAR